MEPNAASCCQQLPFFLQHSSQFVHSCVDFVGFCEGMRNDWFVRHLGMSLRSVVDWLNFCREVCMVCIQESSRQIGRFGCIVEIDKSYKFVKRKYHKGKAKVCKDLVLGGICREMANVL